MADYGFVYCLGNDCMPGIYKIGRTDRAPSSRCDELSRSTSVPTAFDLLFFIECSCPEKVELAMHKTLRDCRVSENREFFMCDLRRIHRQFQIYQEDGDAFAITNTGAGELASLDYQRGPFNNTKDEEPAIAF